METGAVVPGQGPLSEAVEIRFPPAGEEITFRPRGWGRYLVGAFFVFWLCGWAVGEAVALGILFGPFVRPLVVEEFPRIARSLPEGPVPVPVFVFLAVWTAFWTFGGLGALHTLLRLLIGRDRFLIGVQGVSFCQKPFGRTRMLLPRSGSRLLLRRKDKALVMADGKKQTVLTLGGTETDRLWLLTRLRSALGMGEEIAGPRAEAMDPLAVDPGVPDGWEIERLPDGGIVLRKPRADEAKGTGCALLLAVLWTAGVVAFFAKAGPVPEALSAAGGFAAFLILVTAAVLFGTLWTALARERWIIRPGLIEWERLVAGRTWKRESFRNPGIDLSYTEDSDSDDWFDLSVSAPPLSRRVTRTMNNSTAPVNLARFLAYHSKVTPRIAREALEV